MGQFVEIYIDSNNRLRQEKNVILSFLIALRNYSLYTFSYIYPHEHRYKIKKSY
jgi:hypothetical protein